MLAARERISLEEYERVLALPAGVPPPATPMPGTFRLENIRDFRRLYAEG